MSTQQDDADRRAEALVNTERFYDLVRHSDTFALEAAIAEAIRAAVRAEREEWVKACEAAERAGYQDQANTILVAMGVR